MRARVNIGQRLWQFQGLGGTAVALALWLTLLGLAVIAGYLVVLIAIALAHYSGIPAIATGVGFLALVTRLKLSGSQERGLLPEQAQQMLGVAAVAVTMWYLLEQGHWAFYLFAAMVAVGVGRLLLKGLRRLGLT